MKRTYVEWNPHGKTRRLIELAEAICVDYAGIGAKDKPDAERFPQPEFHI